MYNFILNFIKRLKSAFVFYFSKGMNLKILGIDPGSRNCGYAIMEANKGKNILIEAGLIKIKPSTLQYQITELCEGLDLIFKNHSFDEVAIEDIFLLTIQNRFKTRTISRSPIFKILQIHGDFAEYTPLQVKKPLQEKPKQLKNKLLLW